MTPTEPRLDTAAHVVWMGDDGVVRVLARSGMTMTLAEAEALLEAARQLGGATRAPVLIGAVSGMMDRDCRTLFAGPRPARHHSAVALLVRSPLARAIGSIFLGFNRPVVPFRMFEHEADAVAWLRAQPTSGGDTGMGPAHLRGPASDENGEASP